MLNRISSTSRTKINYWQTRLLNRSDWKKTKISSNSRANYINKLLQQASSKNQPKILPALQTARPQWPNQSKRRGRSLAHIMLLPRLKEATPMRRTVIIIHRARLQSIQCLVAVNRELIHSKGSSDALILAQKSQEHPTISHIYRTRGQKKPQMREWRAQRGDVKQNLSGSHSRIVLALKLSQTLWYPKCNVIQLQAQNSWQKLQVSLQSKILRVWSTTLLA